MGPVGLRLGRQDCDFDTTASSALPCTLKSRHLIPSPRPCPGGVSPAFLPRAMLLSSVSASEMNQTGAPVPSAIHAIVTASALGAPPRQGGTRPTLPVRGHQTVDQALYPNRAMLHSSSAAGEVNQTGSAVPSALQAVRRPVPAATLYVSITGTPALHSELIRARRRRRRPGRRIESVHPGTSKPLFTSVDWDPSILIDLSTSNSPPLTYPPKRFVPNHCVQRVHAETHLAAGRTLYGEARYRPPRRHSRGVGRSRAGTL